MPREGATIFRDLLGKTRADVALVAAMGHSSQSMTEHYIQAEPDAAIVGRLQNLVFFSGVIREA